MQATAGEGLVRKIISTFLHPKMLCTICFLAAALVFHQLFNGNALGATLIGAGCHGRALLQGSRSLVSGTEVLARLHMLHQDIFWKHMQAVQAACIQQIRHMTHLHSTR